MKIFWGLVFLGLVFSNFGFAAEERMCLSPPDKSEMQIPYTGYNFSRWTDLNLIQQNLLTRTTGFFPTDTAYTNLTIKENGRATNYLALTQTLMQLTLDLGSEKALGTDLIREISEIRSDRFFAIFDKDLIEKWKKAGGRYEMTLAGGKLEKGNVKFLDHSSKDAGLHCGFDIQWYTNPTKVPHLHWNLRLSDGYGDVHLDGFRSWYFEVIPNLQHLSYENSDVRYWYGNFKKKYGEPQFQVRRDKLAP